jgi:hypothetical protein
MLYIVGKLTNQSCAVAIARHLVVYLRRNGTDPQLSPWLEGRKRRRRGRRAAPQGAERYRSHRETKQNRRTAARRPDLAPR